MVTGNRLTRPKRCSTAATHQVAHRLAVAAIERETNPHLPSDVATDLSIGSPATIALVDCNTAVMAPFDAASMAIEQQAVELHHAVDPLVVRAGLNRPRGLGA
jgi:hypothetical protein